MNFITIFFATLVMASTFAVSNNADTATVGPDETAVSTTRDEVPPPAPPVEGELSIVD